MDLSVKDVARILNVSETTVRGHIASGRLPAHRKGHRVVVSQADLDALAITQALPAFASNVNDDGVSIDLKNSVREGLKPVMDLMSSMGQQVNRVLEFVTENQRLSKEIRRRDQDLAHKDLEMEKLRRDLVYQKRIHAKEMEDHQRMLQDKLAFMEKETVERIAQEREQYEARLAREQEHLEKRLDQERSLWSERLEQERERLSQKLHELSRQEGFWSRLMKMMTWS